MTRFICGITAATMLMLCTACSDASSFPTTYTAMGGTYYSEPFDPS